MKKQLENWQAVLLIVGILAVVALVGWLLSMASWVGMLRWPAIILLSTGLLLSIIHLILSIPKLKGEAIPRAEKFFHIAGDACIALGMMLRLVLLLAGY